MSSIDYLKERQKSIYDSYSRMQIEQNDLLNEIMEIRNEMKKLQIELNALQIAIEKLERTE